MAYSYDDFLKAAQGSGIGFSQHDLDLAKKHPEFGLSALSLKKDYGAASTPEQKLLANEALNQLRMSYGGYSGGADGTQYIAGSKPQVQAQQLLDRVNSYGSFEYDAKAPTYENQYAQQQKDMLDAVVNQPDFNWNKEEDPQWSAYKKQYLREGERAQANALAQAAAASGGRPSSRAITAASQAGDYYAGQLADVLPQLRAQAYDEYMTDYQKLLSSLNAMNAQEQQEYAKYLNALGQYNTDRDFAYKQHLSEFDLLNAQLAANQGQAGTEYAQLLDKLNLEQQKEQREYERRQAQQALEQAQIDAILAAGGSPSAELVGSSGYTNEYIQALEEAYRRENAAKLAAVSGPKVGGDDDREKQDYMGLFAAAKKSGYPKSFIANNYKDYGFTSSTGLYDAFAARESPKGNLDHDEDEGVFTWNGKRYHDVNDLMVDIEEAELSAEEQRRLAQQFATYGWQINFG